MEKIDFKHRRNVLKNHKDISKRKKLVFLLNGKVSYESVTEERENHTITFNRMIIGG